MKFLLIFNIYFLTIIGFILLATNLYKSYKKKVIDKDRENTFECSPLCRVFLVYNFFVKIFVS
jgi:hypothetical protein